MEERVLKHGPPVQPCEVCGHAAYNHRASEPHACGVPLCPCRALKLLPFSVPQPEPQCAYCGHSLSSHLFPPSYGCRDVVATGKKEVPCACRQYKSPDHPKAALIRNVYERSMRTRSGEPAPPGFAAAPRVRRSALVASLSRVTMADPDVQRVLNDYVTETVEELGGVEALTAGQSAMLLGQRTALGVILLAERELSRSEKVVEPNGEPVKTLRTLQGFLTVFRHGQVALGLAKPRRSRKDVTMQDVLDEYKKKSEREGPPN